MLRDSTLLCPLVSRSFCLCVTFYFFMNFIFLPHCWWANGLVTSNMAPAHPNASGVAGDAALLQWVHGHRSCKFFSRHTVLEAFLLILFKYGKWNNIPHYTQSENMCDVWMVEWMHYRLTNQPNEQGLLLMCLLHLKRTSLTGFYPISYSKVREGVRAKEDRRR